MRPTNERKEESPRDAVRICPECGAAMVEFDRLDEESAVFIWYACPVEGCTGQWLTKKTRRMGPFN